MAVLARSHCPDCHRVCFGPGGQLMIEAARTSRNGALADDFLRALEAGNDKSVQQAAAVAIRFEDLSITGTLEIPRELNELRDGLWEIKVGKIRLPFFWLQEPFASTAIRLTHGFIKGTDKTPRREIDKAMWVRREDAEA